MAKAIMLVVLKVGFLQQPVPTLHLLCVADVF